MKRPLAPCCICLMVLASGFLLGCGSGNDPNQAIANANKSNIQRLSNLYVMYQMNNKFRGPKDEAAFKAYIASADIESLESMGVDPNAVDDLFICESDGEPFNIRYNVPTGTRGSKEPVIFQKSGSGGRRMVGFLNMVQREVDDEEYDRLFYSKPARQARTGRNSVAGDSRSGS